MKDSTPEVTVHLRRLDPESVLVIVRGDPEDGEPDYFDKLTREEPVGFRLDPLRDPHRIAIDDGGAYGVNSSSWTIRSAPSQPGRPAP